MAGGLAVDPEGQVWVADSLNSRLMIFTLPELPVVDDTAVDTVTEDGQILDNPFGEETQVEEETQVDVEPTN